MKKYGLFFFLMLVVPNLVYANNISAQISCPSEVSINEEVECSISATISEGNASCVSANYSFNNLEYLSFTKNDIFTADNTYVRSDGFNLCTTNFVTGNVLLGKVKLMVKSGANSPKINLNIGGFSDTNTPLSESDSSFTMNYKKNKSTINTLASLSLNGISYLPTFASETKEYSASTNSSLVNISATLHDSASSFVSGFGPRSISLNYGENIILIKVVSESGAENVYTLKITRNDTRGNNNSLSNLSLSSGDLKFQKNSSIYNVKVDSAISQVKINATLEDEAANFVNGYGPRNVKLNYGDNKFLIKTVAENGTEKVYTININREDDRSTNNNLANIKLSDGNLYFSKDTLDYEVNVPYSVNKISVDVELEDTLANYKVVGDGSLKVGKNKIVITVTAENEEIKTYTIVVTRQDENDTPLSNNNYLSSLKIKNYKIKFDKEKEEYTIKIDEEESLVIEAIAEDENAKVVIKGNEYLSNNKVITIEVTAEDGSKREYKIKIEQSTIDKVFKSVSLIVLIPTISGSSIYLIMKKKNKLVKI
ncbi:MAG: cadherin-like beta sandwich domain-containing protein [bacterium]|nr:cadherin-like beta sandwich domain-containing protein [bacterium]